MQVKYRLSGARTDVEYCPVSMLDISPACNFGGGEVAAPDKFRVFGLSLLQPGEVFFGNDQYVRGGLRMDVLEGENVVVFMDFLRGRFAAEDAAKQAIGGRIAHVSCP